jgi:hypothetical protein
VRRPLLALGLLGGCVALSGCGSAPPPAAAAPAADTPGPAVPVATGKSTPTDEPPEPAALPSACADPAAPACMPPRDFVERLCKTPRQEVALALFGPASPFSRLYLRGKFDELVNGEEVLALRFHGVPKGGIQVGSGAGSYDVLRWDGSCALAADADMLGKTRPQQPRTARVLWNRIGDKVQTALVVGSDAIKAAHNRRGRECGGTSTGDVSAGCQKSDGVLGEAIGEYVRGGGKLPGVEVP